MKPDSMDFLEVPERYAVEVPEDDYTQFAVSDSCVAYLEPGTQGR